ncbi:MAG: family 2 glycosyl transferase [Parcubacteria group bacterium GW2011_GWA2_44_12]|nr:MAG: family 2 glycosyl transferase [Parcubacteria group bacterium GW2011_GWA2_44_12]
MDDPQVSVIILLYNSRKYLPFCFKSLREQTFKNFEILVIDNGSIDGGFEWVKQCAPETKIVRNPANVGFAKGNNRGVYWSSGDFIFFLNADVFLNEDALEQLVSYLSAHDEVAAVTPKSCVWNFSAVTDLYGSFSEEIVCPGRIGDIPGKTDMIDSLGLKIERSYRVTEIGNGKSDAEIVQREPMEIFGASAASLLMKREALYAVAVQGEGNNAEFFDEDFFAYKEDVDLAYRLRLKGWKTYLVPSARVFHDRSAKQQGASVLRNRKTKSKFINYHSYKNHMFFLMKNLSLHSALRNFFPILFYEARKFFYLLLLEQSSLAGLKKIFKKMPKMLAKRRAILGSSDRATYREIQKWMH